MVRGPQLSAFSLSWSCIFSCSKAFVYLNVPLVFDIRYQSYTEASMSQECIVAVPTVRTKGPRDELLEGSLTGGEATEQLEVYV